MNTLGIVMAKSQSLRAPNKNIADICGKPMLAYAIESIKASGLCSHVVVSVNSVEYGDIGVEHGADDYVLRDSWSDAFAQFSVTADEARKQYENRTGIRFDEVVVSGANVMFLRPSWLRAAAMLMRNFAYNRMPIDVVGMEPYNWNVNVCRVKHGMITQSNFYVLKHVGLLMEMDYPHELELAREVMENIKNNSIQYPLQETVHEDMLANRQQIKIRMAGLTLLSDLHNDGIRL